MPMNSAAPRRWRIRSLESWSLPSPESTMKRMGWTVVSAVISVDQGRAQVTLTPSVTRRAAAARFAEVIRLIVPSSSSVPQRPQLESVRRYSRTCASVGAVATERLLQFARVDLHHRGQELERPRLLALERVPPDDGAEAAAVADGPAFVEDRLVVLLGGAAREDDDAPAVEGRLDDVAHALGQRRDRHAGLFVDLLRLRLLDVLGGWLDLDDMRPELRGDLRGVRHDVDRRLPLLADRRAAWVGPDHRDEAVGLGLGDHLAALLVHGLRVGRARVDREAHGDAAQPERVLDRARHGGERILLVV